MKLFGHPESGHAFKVRFYLIHTETPHDYEVVDIERPRHERQPEFRDNAPFGEVPLLIDEGFALAQSNAILLHLDEKRRTGLADDEVSRARTREWLMWEANKIGLCLPQLRVYHRFEGHGISPGAQAWLEERYRHDVGVLNNTLADGRDWILSEGTEPGIADFSLCGYLVHAEEAKVDVPAHVAAWLRRLQSLQGWQPPYDMLA